MKDSRIVSRKFEIDESHRLHVAREHGGYNAVETAFALEAEAIVEVIKESGLRGKSGH